jgi:hypothetical protein
MKRVLLAVAASIAAFAFQAAPVGAQQRLATALTDPRSPEFAVGSPRVRDFGQCSAAHRDRHTRRHRGVSCDGYFAWPYADGEWALYNNRSWEPDSYNDWWHDRPDRAFPRWVQEQRGGPCPEERMWWSGSGWHC